ncbi:carboxylate-amine ligase [Propionivibrio sp.]|uniref:carboxylate-amine ligase n=1 Tax=Propionivibrio sp. TaxID=2212460 RepID=UPI0039E62F88
MSSGHGAAARPAFSAHGVELEYMIVDGASFAVRPLAPFLLQRDGRVVGELRRDGVGWSNELMSHVVELKNAEPVAALTELPAAFRAEIREMNARLAPLGARLMPGGMHPWMDPRREAQLWTHEHAAIYRSFDRIFDCRQHGWANLQSMHLNLPFGDDREFARLHAAIRLALPILPALSASSPWADGRFSGFMDYRLEIYRHHQKIIPSTIGDCIPDPSASPADYRARVLEPMLRDVARYDALLGEDAGSLSHEWIDVRAAAPRFARSAIEIRVLDVQECPTADLSIAAAATALAQRLYERAGDDALPTAVLVAIFAACIRDAERAVVADREYLARLGLPGRPHTAGELWAELVETLAGDGLLAPCWLPALRLILRRGTLARRLDAAIAGDPARLPAVCRELCACLDADRMFPGDAAA